MKNFRWVFDVDWPEVKWWAKVDVVKAEYMGEAQNELILS